MKLVGYQVFGVSYQPVKFTWPGETKALLGGGFILIFELTIRRVRLAARLPLCLVTLKQHFDIRAGRFARFCFSWHLTTWPSLPIPTPRRWVFSEESP